MSHNEKQDGKIIAELLFSRQIDNARFWFFEWMAISLMAFSLLVFLTVFAGYINFM